MDLEQTAIARIREAAHMSEKLYHLPLVVTDSGGKDSSVCVALAERSGVNFEAQHNLTTADAPETVYFVRKKFHRMEDQGIKCSISYPKYKGIPVTMWSLIPQKLIPPTRLARYCCDILKEQGGKGRFIVTGVRWAESVNRKNQRGIYESVPSKARNRIILTNDNDDRRLLFESCSMKGQRVCNPIIDWSDRDIWDYIHAEHIPVNSLYSCGFNRVGCIGCPMASKARWKEFGRYPKYQDMYVHAFERMLGERKRRGRPVAWKTAEEVFHWWMEDGILPGQIGFDEWMQDGVMADQTDADGAERITKIPPPEHKEATKEDAA